MVKDWCPRCEKFVGATHPCFAPVRVKKHKRLAERRKLWFLNLKINSLVDDIAYQERYGTGSPELTFMRRRLTKLDKEYNDLL